MNHCLRHYEEPIEAICRACKHPFCGRCLVYSFGLKKPPYCVGCALHASGIRNGTRMVAAQTGAVDRRTERALRRAERDALKQMARAERKANHRATPEPPSPATAENGSTSEAALDPARAIQPTTPSTGPVPVHHQA